MTLEKLILATKSVDRMELFKKAGLHFEVIKTDVNEDDYKSKYSNPHELAKALAKAKALRAKEMLNKTANNFLIVAADTLVYFNDEIIGKAANEQEAFINLKKMVGKTHQLITGIAILDVKKNHLFIDADTTEVSFLKLSDDDIHSYIKTNEWKGRAGSYSISERASLFIESIKGSPSNVIGLPMHLIFKILKKEFGINLLNTNQKR